MPRKYRETNGPGRSRRYDRSDKLRKNEAAALEYLVSRQLYGHFRGRVRNDLERLTQPILDVVAATGTPKQSGDGAMGALVLEMHRRQTSFWKWPRDVWLEILGPTARSFHVRYKWTTTHGRHSLVTATYLLGLFDDFRALGIIDRTALACRIFGRQRVHSHIKTVIDVIRSWGFGRYKAKDVQWALCSVLLANKSPNLHDDSRCIASYGTVAALLLFVCGYLLARVIGAWIDGLMATRSGPGVVLLLILSISVLPRMIPAVLEKEPLCGEACAGGATVHTAVRRRGGDDAHWRNGACWTGANCTLVHRAGGVFGVA